MKVYTFLDLFRENAQVLAKKYNLEYTDELNLENPDTFVIFGSHHADYSYKLLTYHFRYSLNYVIINSEQNTSSAFKKNYYIKLLKISKVVDYNYISANFITDNFNIPVSVSYFFDYNIKVPNKNKKYDILFTGSKNETRNEIMNNLMKKYEDKNIFYGNNISPLKLSTLLIDTKVVLNIPYYPDGILEIHRIHQALSCGCIVVSSRGKDLEQNKLYEDYIYFTEDFNTVDYDSLVPKKSYEELQSILYSKRQFDNFILEKNKYTIIINSKDFHDRATSTIIESIPHDIVVIVVSHGLFNFKQCGDNIFNLVVPHNSIDYTGLIAILEHKEIVQRYISDIIFYTHNTAKFGSKFFELFEPCGNKSLTSYPSMNIGTYNYSDLIKIEEEVKKFKSSNFPSDAELNKLKINCIKHEDFLFKLLNVKNWYCDKNKILLNGPSDVYNTGTLRITEYYSQVDFYKYKANWGQKTENVILNL